MYVHVPVDRNTVWLDLCAENVFVYFTRRSYVGVELVQWLCEQCVYVRCRTTAVRVWQVLLELGVLLSGKNTTTHALTNTHTLTRPRIGLSTRCP